ncbi:MAG: S-methyl-5-thioribose-1-phosphate isomerase, partial [Caldilinea sp.]
MTNQSVRAVFWENWQVMLIDQRLLPGTFAVNGYATVAAVAEAIQTMVVRGAPAIGAAGAYAMVLAAHTSPAHDTAGLLADLRRAKALLDDARPTAVNLSWATARMLNAAEQAASPSVAVLQGLLLDEADAIAEEDVAINRRMGFHGAALIADGANLLHHCNTGALATVDFGTALGVVYACAEQGKRVHVWVDETR